MLQASEARNVFWAIFAILPWILWTTQSKTAVGTAAFAAIKWF